MSVERAIELQDRAWDLQAEGKLDEALVTCREAVRLVEESEGTNSPELVNLLNDLGEVENERQDFRTALALAERAKRIEDALGDRFAGEAAARIRGKTLELLGEIRCKLGDYTRAETDLKTALEIATGEFGKGSDEEALAQNNLAVLYKYWGRFDEGLRLYEQALRSIVALHGEDSLASGVVYHNIGGIWHARGDFAAAEQPGRRAWEISRQVLGEEHPRTMSDAVAYAGIVDGLERYDESEPIYRRALELFEKRFGPEHYEVAAILHNLASVAARRGDLEQAEAHYRRALAIKENLLGPESPDAALTSNNLGRLLSRAGRFREGVPLLKSAVAILETRLPPGHPHVALARENLEWALSSMAASHAADV